MAARCAVAGSRGKYNIEAPACASRRRHQHLVLLRSSLQALSQSTSSSRRLIWRHFTATILQAHHGMKRSQEIILRIQRPSSSAVRRPKSSKRLAMLAGMPCQKEEPLCLGAQDSRQGYQRSDKARLRSLLSLPIRTAAARSALSIRQLFEMLMRLSGVKKDW